tara:strand:+ start:999 stop:1859 length:861 start_codon:yes stop_codon:yes gene_type:complete
LFNLIKIFFNFSVFNKKIEFISCEERFENLIIDLQQEKYLAIDTEFDWRNTYFPKLSLIQIGTTKNIYLIDCLNEINLSSLQNLLNDKKIIKIFHAVRSDSTVLSTAANLRVNDCFDVQMAEKFLSEGDLKSYAKIVLKYFGLKIDKSQTNSNWLKRPFSNNQLSYAANDVRFLIEIHKKQIKALKKRNLEEKILESSKKESSLGNEELYVSRLKKLKSSEKLAKDLFLWRENKAIENNIPPSFIFKDKFFKKLLKSFQNEISKEKILKILNNENLTNDLIDTIKK